MESSTKDQLDDERVAIYKALLRVPPSFCKKLGLMPKRGDYECDYDNNAELSIARIRSDFLDDELYRDLTLARIDMFVEILRRRRMRHLVAAKLNLLTHVLPKLLPSKATSSSYGDSHVRAMSGQSQLSGGSSRPSRRCLISQRRFGQRMLQATRFGHIGERSGKLGDLSTEETVKQPPSIESLQDSGVAFSESSIHSLPSLDTPGTASVSSPTEDAATCEDNSRDASSPTTLTRIWSFSLPSVGSNPLEVVSSVHPSEARLDIRILSSVYYYPPCISFSPEFVVCCRNFAEPLKPLLRFLSPSEANILLRQLHREHVLRQEIEQLQQLKKSQGIFLKGTHLAGEILSTTGNDSDGSSPEDTTRSLASRTGAVGMLSRRRRSIFFGVSRRSKRRVDRLSTPVGVERERGVRRGGATAFPTGNGVAPRRRGRPSLHNQGNRQQSQRHQLIHM
ncbi:unnamed protein product [Hydatigera taeniaeformis]|uniref:DMAP1-binding domain-containing protein n=1 Tax=Hydatigena taeniaeformis TaxID=6205 RepID=A0A0R3X2C6_HYDTA|nr:unnamed protein product [Hydatigera taeniaeformis]